MLLNIHPQDPQPKKLAEVIDCLKKGGVIIYPTDTIYAIGCDLNNKKAIKRIAQIKGKELHESHFSIVCYDLKHISEYTLPFSNSVYKLMKSSLPGAFTFILNANKKVPKIFDFNKSSIGIRVPDNHIARTLVQELGNPLIATSVYDNGNGREYLTDPSLIHEQYEKLVDIVIDGGLGSDDASTVIDATGKEPVLERDGKGEVEVI